MIIQFTKGTTSIGLRLEDLKRYPRKTLPALCKWLDIKETESLYEMTVQGKKWWGDPTSPDYKIDGMDTFGLSSINRKTGVFSVKRSVYIKMSFYPFSVLYGYVDENKKQFLKDLGLV